MKNKRSVLSLLMIFLGVPLCVIAGAIMFSDRRYMLISLAAAALSCAAFYFAYDRRDQSTRRVVIIAALTALSVGGRFLFAPIPFFKPVTAIVVICGIFMGSSAGFMCGSLSAFLSNFFFMQGPWTPFQMFIWGLIGFLAGALSKPLQKSRALLVAFGAFAGIVYSAFMDIWSTIWFDGVFLPSRYAAAVTAAVPVTIIYIISNVVFLLALCGPIGRKLDRLRTKYGID